MFGRFATIFVVLIAAVGLSACTEKPPQRIQAAKFNTPSFSDAEAVWRNATLALPVRGSVGSMVTTNDGAIGLLQLAGAKPSTRWPVILILNGCEQKVSLQLMRAFAEQGFVTFSLDSAARRREPIDCGPDKDGHERARLNSQYKEGELDYALNELQSVSWADTQNFFLLGIGEGSTTVARNSGRFVKARILAEWDCSGGSSAVGVQNDEGSPVLLINSAGMPIGKQDGCATYLVNQIESQSLTLPESYPNGILLEPIVFTQMLQFLDRQLFK
ncbi:hypothetical protein A9Q83_09565 [Alphaproteobacteria bacterium 46_93_T64]|nr:hypothetical protein A9Q83_09565 [Alphaproteobacteria bacterium 46_93_T64]